MKAKEKLLPGRLGGIDRLSASVASKANMPQLFGDSHRSILARERAVISNLFKDEFGFTLEKVGPSKEKMLSNFSFFFFFLLLLVKMYAENDVVHKGPPGPPRETSSQIRTNPSTGGAEHDG